ncbi:MFS general substrate transporter [Pleurostoma richardsiae]|uniref:MFS general substrate transporter n=1 Tax=Pleurostoma richardsiae TaxID=41990 RepID=A0AA38W000_9PEZI|nr:MFS general substrate transporter [Pleurostoma richardsiae]
MARESGPAGSAPFRDDSPASKPDSSNDGEFPSSEGTATEGTPLLRSEVSSQTARDDAPTPKPSGPDAADHAVSPLRAVCIIASMWALIFLQASNMSGMTMTQSVIAEELQAYDGAMWFTSSYLITTASLAPLVGRLSTIFSPGIMILFSSFFFAVGALVASQAHSFGVFILGRVLIGVGGAGIMTLSLILVLQLASKRRRGIFVGLVNAGFTIGLSTGAVVFGALLEPLGWRALFWIQAPIGIVAGIGVYFSMPAFATGKGSKDKTVLQKVLGIDYAGAATLTATIVLFLYGLSGTIQILPIVLSLVTLVLFVVTEYFVASDPLIPLKVLQSRGVLLSCLAQQGFMAARWTVLYYAPIFVLAVRGLSPAVAGAVLIPTNAGFGSGGLIIGWLHVRRAGSFWLPCLVSIALFGAALFGLGLVSNAAAPAWLYVAVVFANGFCTGAALNYTLAHLLHLAEPETHFIATSMLATFRGFAGSFGTSIGGGIFTRTLRASLEEGYRRLDGGGDGAGRAALIKRLVGSPALVFRGGLSEAERLVAVRGYEDSLRVLYRSACALVVVVLFLQAGTGWTAPVSDEEEEEIREEILEHDGNMEA